MNEALIVIVVVALLLPPVVYITVKVGTFAFYRGRQVHQDFETKRRKKNGKA